MRTTAPTMRHLLMMVCASACLLITNARAGIIMLDSERAVEIGMENSYRIQQIQLGVERSRRYLKAQRAGLKSRVYMNLQTPDFNAVSDYKWNSTLQRDEIVRENSRRWQADLSIRQPVILFGYPTNGYLSLNNKLYRYRQKTDNGVSVDYYNRYFVRFEQPLFRPNELKNDIEESELDLEEQELGYVEDLMDMVQDVMDDYYEIFEYAYRDRIYSEHVATLEHIADIVNEMAGQDTTRVVDTIQARVELANARERLLENSSRLRIQVSEMKQQFRLADSDSIVVPAEIGDIEPLEIDVEEALERGFSLRPRFRRLEIRRRNDEIDLENTKGRNAFHMNLEMTYGLEKMNEEYEKLYDEFDNSYSVSVNAYIPIWDWGQRKAYVEAEEIQLERTALEMEETRHWTESEITSAITNFREYQQRALNMYENLENARELTDLSMEQFRRERISLQDLLQVVNRHNETKQNFLEVYLDMRTTLMNLLEITYYDWEKDMPFIDAYADIVATGVGGGENAM